MRFGEGEGTGWFRFAAWCTPAGVTFATCCSIAAAPAAAPRLLAIVRCAGRATDASAGRASPFAFGACTAIARRPCRSGVVRRTGRRGSSSRGPHSSPRSIESSTRSSTSGRPPWPAGSRRSFRNRRGSARASAANTFWSPSHFMPPAAHGADSIRLCSWPGRRRIGGESLWWTPSCARAITSLKRNWILICAEGTWRARSGFRNRPRSGVGRLSLWTTSRQREARFWRPRRCWSGPAPPGSSPLPLPTAGALQQGPGISATLLRRGGL